MTQSKRNLTPTEFQPVTQNTQGTGGSIGLSPAKVGLILLALGLFAALAFVLAAKSLTVIVNQTHEANVDVKGGFSVNFGGRFLLLPGEYTISVAAAGFQAAEIAYTVTRDESQQLQVELKALPGRITLNLSPANATVQLNGETITETTLELEPATYELLVQADRYQAKNVSLEVEGKGITQEFVISLDPNWATITIHSEPANAEVYLNNIRLGATPLTADILAGQHELRLEKQHYQPATQTLDVDAGADQSLPKIVLDEANGQFKIESDPIGATVMLDGRYKGLTPVSLTLEPGQEHTITLTKPGFQALEVTRKLAAGGSAKEMFNLKPMLGRVTFAISPADASITANGRKIGQGSTTLDLPQVEQKIIISKPGYEPFITVITPRNGIAQTVAATLITEAAARKARLQSIVKDPTGAEMVLIDPAGKGAFTMGSSRRDSGRRANETERSVQLTRAFYIAKQETTNAQFRLFEASHDSGVAAGNSLNRQTQPAVKVSWQQAAQFCNWLSRREGLPLFYKEQNGIIVGFNPEASGYRLPSEAEWEFVTRVTEAGERRFLWGETFPPANNTENFADASSAHVTGRIVANYQDGYVATAPVASFNPGPHGLFDLAGNVAEWVHDVYEIRTPSEQTETNPLGKQVGDNYVIKGASWSLSKLTELRLSYRDYGARGRDDVGFRVARYAE